MNKKNSIFLRTILIILSLVLFYLAINLVIVNFSLFFEQLKNGINLNFDLIKFDFLTQFIIYIILGIILLDIGIFYNRIFKTTANIFVSIGILWITFTIFLFTFNSYTPQIVGDIQPSIDSILLDTVNTYADDYINKSTNKNLNIKLLLFSNISIENLNNNNLTLTNANYLCNQLDLCNSYSNDDKILFSKIFITLIYQQLNDKSPDLLNTPIPISTIKSTITSQGLDLSLLNSISPKDLVNIYPINSNSKIKILKSTNSKTILVSANSLTLNESQLIWNNLNLSNNISDFSKLKIIKILLSSIPEIQKSLGDQSDLSKMGIPLASIQNQIPSKLKDLLKYDILSTNKTISQKSLENIRNDCNINLNNSQSLDEITNKTCNVILITKYNNLMNYISTMNSSNLPINIDINKTISNYKTLDKVKKTLNEKTNLWSLTLFLTLISFIFAIISYYLHFHLFNRELIKFHIGYYISKKNLIVFAESFVLFSILYYLIISDFLFEKIKTLNLGEIEKTISIIENVPLFETLKSIFTSIFYLMIYYLIISIIIYGIFFYLQKKEIKKLETLENKTF